MTDEVPIRLLLPEAVAHVHHPDFFFVNVGANDGVSYDPIYEYLQRYQWRGLAVEPVPYMCEQLRATYARFPGVIVEHCAVAATARPLYHVPPGPGREQFFLRQISSFDRGYVEKTIRLLRENAHLLGPVPEGLEAHIAPLAVPCLTFDALLQKYGIERFDFLNIDAESADFEIFMMVDLDRFRPSLICMETGTFSAAERGAALQRLAAAGYELLEPFGPFSEVYIHAAARPPHLR